MKNAEIKSSLNWECCNTYLTKKATTSTWIWKFSRIEVKRCLGIHYASLFTWLPISNDIEGTCKLEIELVETTKIVQNRLIKNTHIQQYIQWYNSTIILNRIASFDLLHFFKGSFLSLSWCVCVLSDRSHFFVFPFDKNIV